MSSLVFTPCNTPSNDHAFSNMVFLNPLDHATLQAQNKSGGSLFVEINRFIVKVGKAKEVPQGQLGLSKYQRDSMQIAKNDEIKLKIPKINQNPLSQVQLTVDLLFKDDDCPVNAKGQALIKEKDIADALFKLMKGSMFINHKEVIPLTLLDGLIILTVKVNQIVGFDTNLALQSYGLMEDEQDCKVRCNEGKNSMNVLKIEKDEFEIREIIKDDFKSLGIGGLDKEFKEIFRRAFNSRRYPAEVLEKYGIKHIRGMLLYGPPGTGKTLIARQIANALDCKKPKVVNGPEVLSKYQGESEENIRKLFKDAEDDMKTKGDKSPLHIIIFDEIDAICRQRGSTSSGTGVQETIVNQLLSKIDGVDSLNNILIIGMTNRKDMIDEAMLRPGRLEIHLEIGLPDEFGRLQIFEIHTKDMREHKLMADDVDLKVLASQTKNYTGAEIEAVCRGAKQYALFENVDLTQITQKDEETKGSAPSGKQTTQKVKSELFTNRKVTVAHFEAALRENKPAFGVDDDNISNCIRGGILQYGEAFNEVYRVGLNFINEIQNTKTTPLLSILLEGKNGSGKTALASKLALESKFPYVKMISPEKFVGYSEQGKISQIVKIFEDAYKSPLSLIILDDLERLIEFIHIGPRFSNPILQALLVLIKKKPPNPDRKLLIIGTTSMKSVLQEMELVDCFNVCQHVPSVRLKNEFTAVLSHYKASTEEVRKISQALVEGAEGEDGLITRGGIPIKNFILSIELAIQSNPKGQLEYSNFMEAHKAVSH